MTGRGSRFRSYALLVSPAFRGATGWACFGATIQIVAGASFSLYPLGLRYFTDGIVQHDHHKLVLGVVLTATLFIAFWGLNFLGGGTSFLIAGRADLYLTTRIARVVDRLPGLEHFERPEYLAELETLQRDKRILATTALQVLNLTAISVRLIVMFVLLVSVSPLFLLLPVAALAPYYCDKASVRYRKRIDDELGERVRLAKRYFELASTAAPASELRTFGLQREVEQRRAALASEIVRRTSRAGFVAGILAAAGALVFAAAFIALMTLAIVRAIDGHTSPGEVLLVLVLVQNLQTQIGLIAGNTGQLLRARLTAERLVWLESEAERLAKAKSEVHPPSVVIDGITFDKVAFVYPGTDATVLREVSVHIPAGKAVAIVGENGAGKSTIAKLLSRMYEPTSGEIRIDGTELGAFDVEEWREQVTATFQDFSRYQLRAGRSVGIGDLPSRDDDALAHAALRDSGGESVIANLGQGLDTQLGRFFAGGQDLSGGEWQKVALGRGRMRREPLLLILDEPTASLDPIAEGTLFDHYVAAAREVGSRNGAITVLVSHRFSTVRTADLILVLYDGEVAEFGSHEQLMAAGGRYAGLFALQEQGYR